MRAAVDAWGPFVFVHADPEAPPLRESLGELPELLEDRVSARTGGEGLVFRERATYTGSPQTGRSPSRTTSSATTAPSRTRGSPVLSTSIRDAYVLEGRNAPLDQYGETRDGAGSCQFHLVWPALKVNAYPGVANLSIGPVWPVAVPERTDGFLDYYFGEGRDRRRGRAELIAFDDRVGVGGLGSRRVGPAGRPVGA